MSEQKEELIKASELARRLKVNPSYIGNKIKKL
jgi:DNA-binding MarR family transcriptional regulator